ncbi:MAG: class II aldolase/adducin family protein [Treponema sp.]|jgi:rhamnose utilization protein RhaD (predicted bifunctional aldolase and dehydrogenase)|nr:class II aldolase/adducin family protein [Treponema sp.]
MSIEALVEISRFYGTNPDYVLAGGGNTSWKDSDTLYVKGSGIALASVVPASFVKMDRNALARIWEKSYLKASDERESAVLADMMAARKAGEEQKRPSVEALLHDILPFAFVVHLHPALVNGLTCSQRGEAAMKEIFDHKAFWIPSTNPGYILAKQVKTAMEYYLAKYSKPTAIIFLQNHGVFAGAESVEGIKELYVEVMSKIGAMIRRKPDFAGEIRESGGAVVEITRTLAELAGGSAAFLCDHEIAALVKDRTSFAPVSSAFTPDHIVYAGSDPLFSEAKTETGLREAWKNHIQKTGRNPKIIAVQGLGVFGAAATEKAAGLALELFRDAVKVAVYAESFGGPRFMTRDQIEFINNWEVERFRSGVSTK